MRANVSRVVIDHWRTLVGTGVVTRKWIDVAFNAVVPIGAGIGTFLAGPHPDRSDVAALLTVVGILTGLLFQLLVSILANLREEANRSEPPLDRVTAAAYLDLLSDLDSTISYSVLVGCLTAGGLGFGILFGSADWARWGSSLAVTAMVHFGLTVLVVLKRYRATANVAIEQANQRLWRNQRGPGYGKTGS